MVYPQGLFTTSSSDGGGGRSEDLDRLVSTGTADAMTPLDSGNGVDNYIAPSWDDDTQHISLAESSSLAAGLKAAREATGRSLEDLADATRVRRQYLVAIEEGAYDRLPSRPFSTGYIRAYARALGLDEETAADRFKAECPDASAPLRAPVGSDLDDVKPRHTGWIVGALVLISAVVVWNVVRHTMTTTKHGPSDLVTEVRERWTTGWTPGVPIRVNAPLPAPKDQSVPPPYNTPGMPDLGPVAPTAASLAATFHAKGAVFGAAAADSAVTLQARKPALVALRTADGVVVFQHQLAVGEAYRAPQTGGPFSVVVSDPQAFDVYLNGSRHGGLRQLTTPLQTLNAQAAELAARAQAAAPTTQAAVPTPPRAG
jgi:cytoskeleton protein RodZ